jgi:hypothetical protein
MPKNIADAFANYFKSMFNTSCLTVTPPYFISTYFLAMAHISATEVSRAILVLNHPSMLA